MMVTFKPVLDAVAPGEMDQLCNESPHFGQFACLLSDFAGAISAGAFDVELGRK